MGKLSSIAGVPTSSGCLGIATSQDLDATVRPDHRERPVLQILSAARMAPISTYATPGRARAVISAVLLRWRLWMRPVGSTQAQRFDAASSPAFSTQTKMTPVVPDDLLQTAVHVRQAGILGM